ncbi:hypothetical protein ACEQ6C_38730, partial [Rhizobium ruizarguesonis]
NASTFVTTSYLQPYKSSSGGENVFPPLRTTRQRCTDTAPAQIARSDVTGASIYVLAARFKKEAEE